jgi:pSer/pThr/pTyr-binding forkhead associated (FHA) protein
MACLIRLDNGQVFNISNKIDIIGRGSSASIFLDDEGVSRNHAEIFMMSGCVEVIDLNSRNGISVNAEKVRKSFLNDGDKVSIGSVSLVYSAENISSNQTIQIPKTNLDKKTTPPIMPSSASGRFELTQFKADDSIFRTDNYSHNAEHLEILLKAALELNGVEGIERFSKTTYRYIQKNLTPSMFIIELENSIVCETPVNSREKISRDLLDNSLSTGVSFLRKRNSTDATSAVISCPIFGEGRNIYGVLYLESTERDYSTEDILFVRALCALASGVDPKASGKTTVQGSQLKPQDLQILGSSEPVNQLKARIDNLSNEDIIMISGPPGTDRRVIANNLHCMGHYSGKPYISVDCSVLNQSVIHETLFGRSGLSDGKFGLAEGGTLFLNRICCISQEIQELLHLYIQSASIIPLGDTQPKKIKLQLILGIRGRPEDAVSRQALCSNLLGDMKGKRIHMPHLRDRREDVLEITEHYFNESTQKYRKTGMILTDQAKQLLVNYPWPGNDRELDLVIERAVLCCDHQELTPEYLTLPGQK